MSSEHDRSDLMFCISPHAMVSALARRAAEEGYEPTRADLVSVLELGCTREQILAAFDRAGAMTAGVRTALDALPARR